MALATGRSSPKQERSRRRVADILKATRRVLREQGLKALTTNSIAAEANIPVSSIYQYFPDKIAILSALYEDYLEQILAAYEKFDLRDDPQAPWQERMCLLLETLYQSEQREGIETELEQALGLFPELREIDERHAKVTTGKFADYLQRFGARASRARLERVSAYLYELNSALWAYRARYPRQRKEHKEFSLNAALGVLAPYFET